MPGHRPASLIRDPLLPRLRLSVASAVFALQSVLGLSKLDRRSSTENPDC